jgi:hypothetical protein
VDTSNDRGLHATRSIDVTWLMTIQGSYTQLVDYVRRRAKDIAYQEPSLEPGISKFRELVLAEAADDFLPEQKHSVLDNKPLDNPILLADTPLNPHPRLSMTTPEFVAKLEKYAQTVPSEVAGYIRNIPVWLEQEETKIKAAIAYLVSEGHTVSKDGAVVASPAQAPVTPPVVA